MANAVISDELLREADNAASDAAADARAEVLERAEQESAPGTITAPPMSRRRAKRLAQQSTSTEGWKNFIVDVWLVDLNPTEFGIFKRSRNRARSRQFTKDMDIFAEVIEDGERTGLIGYRKELWKNNSDAGKRLVFKMFTDKLHWRATMDLMLARSVQQTLGARLLPVTTYSINSANEDQVVYLERSANKWPLMPENFSFFLLQEKGLEFFRIRQDFIRLGDDYTVYNGRNERIAILDGAFFTISGKWRGRVREDYAEKPLLNVLQMFCAMLIFNDECRHHIKQIAKKVVDGSIEPKIEKQERDLYMNPRRVR
ncbi:MAG: hypothetical protein KKB37_15255 [Alphaproteobacteria bacterium]|nr:hypothetical protein [Alphaproteobacteria bacterium]